MNNVARSFIIAIQLNYYQLGVIVNSNRYNAVSYPSTNYHGCIILDIETGVIFGKPPLVWSQNATNKGQSELTPVRVSR